MNKKTQRRESHSGYHFYNLYQNCQMKFYIKYVLRLLPIYTAPPLINGAAFHEGKAVFYTTHSKKKALDKVVSEIKDREKEVEYQADYEQMLERCPILLDYWIEKFGYQDLDLYNVIAVEQELKTLLKNGTNAYLTQRPDTLLQRKTTGLGYIMETKTSSFSVRLTEMGVENGDQASAYITGVKEAYPHIKFDGMIADVAYWNKKATTEDNIICSRSDIINRKPRDLKIYRAQVAQIFSEISTKLQAVERKKKNPYILFARNTHYCNAFFKSCEYINICRD